MTYPYYCLQITCMSIHGFNFKSMRVTWTLGFYFMNNHWCVQFGATMASSLAQLTIDGWSNCAVVWIPLVIRTGRAYQDSKTLYNPNHQRISDILSDAHLVWSPEALVSNFLVEGARKGPSTVILGFFCYVWDCFLGAYFLIFLYRLLLLSQWYHYCKFILLSLYLSFVCAFVCTQIVSR